MRTSPHTPDGAANAQWPTDLGSLAPAMEEQQRASSSGQLVAGANALQPMCAAASEPFEPPGSPLAMRHKAPSEASLAHLSAGSPGGTGAGGGSRGVANVLSASHHACHFGSIRAGW